MRSEIHTASTGRYRRYSLNRAVVAVFRALSVWDERARQRRVLASLDDRLLSDIGLNRVDVAREARKPFWRA